MKHNNTLWKQKQLIFFLFQKNNKMQEVWYLFRSLITINQYFQLTKINSLVLNDSSYTVLFNVSKPGFYLLYFQFTVHTFYFHNGKKKIRRYAICYCSVSVHEGFKFVYCILKK